jgi:serine/threonine protein kinase
LVKLEYAFQSPGKFFFVMPFYRGGELFQHLRQANRFSEDRTRFYAAQILLGIEFLHKNNIIYRDLKPENILLDDEGNICLADFGMAKLLNSNLKTESIVGTPEYIAPEVLQNEEYGKPADWWSFGTLM